MHPLPRLMRSIMVSSKKLRTRRKLMLLQELLPRRTIRLQRLLISVEMVEVVIINTIRFVRSVESIILVSVNSYKIEEGIVGVTKRKESSSLRMT